MTYLCCVCNRFHDTKGQAKSCDHAKVEQSKEEEKKPQLKK